MKYTFPIIRHISDVLPAIEGSKEFTVTEKEGYTVVSYFMTNPHETFPAVEFEKGWSTIEKNNKALRRECRGLIFEAETGVLLSRGYHKFFNQNEREETQNIDLSQPHVILEKLDGSMIRPLFLKGNKGRPRWITKAGITEVGMQVELWLAENPELQNKYEKLAKQLQDSGYTPIFEWCSRKQRIVLDYPHDMLVLTAIRNNLNGGYESHQQLESLARQFGIPCVGIKNSADVKDTEGDEGVVNRFDDGHMVKVKTDWYVLRHKALDGLRSEKNVLKLIIDGGIDDVLPILDDSTKQRLTDYATTISGSLTEHSEKINQFMIAAKQAESRKEFALVVQNNFKDSILKSVIFKVYDGTESFKALLDLVSKNLQSQTTVDKIRPLLGATW